MFPECPGTTLIAIAHALFAVVGTSPLGRHCAIAECICKPCNTSSLTVQ